MIGRTTLVLGLLALSLAAPVVRAQTAVAETAAPVANAVDPGAIQALKDMGAHLQTLRCFQATTTLTGERVLADGQKLQHSATAELDVDRPNRLRARMVSAPGEWPWSSYRAHVGEANPPPWLDTDGLHGNLLQEPPAHNNT